MILLPCATEFVPSFSRSCINARKIVGLVFCIVLYCIVCTGMQGSSGDVMTLMVFLLLLLTQVPVATTVFQSSSGIASEFHIMEETPAGTLVGSARDNPRLLQTDNNTDSLRFFVRAGTSALPGEHFAVDEQSGEIRTRKPVDREQVCLSGITSCSVVFDIVVRPLKYFQIIRVIVHVEDINDNTPTFPQQQLTLHIKESSLSGSMFPLPVATDADSGIFGIQGFELISSSMDLFSLEVKRNVEESFDLRLQLTGELDRELISEHQLSIVAFDGGNPPRSATMNITVMVTDANDHSPHFASPSYEVDVVENELPSSAIVRVEATDADELQNSQLVYGLAEFSQTEYSDVFRVNPATGEVFLRRRLDREVQSVYSLTVTASDHGSPALTAFTRVVVRVVDDNDNAPRVVVSSASRGEQLTVVENSPPSAFIAHVSASDADLGSAGKVDCYLTGRQFRLESVLGAADSESEYKMLSATSFDRELQSTVVERLTCSDRGHPRPQSVAVELVVEVTDDNDHSPVIASEIYEVDVSESVEIDSEVIRINATDADAGNNARLRFTLTATGQTPERGFTVDETTGSVRTDIRLDHETCRLYEYVVSVSDSGEVARTSTASLTLHVIDTDDERPQFHHSTYYFSVLEDAPVGTVVGRVAAVDNDLSSSFSTVLYYIQGARLPFSIDRQTGELTIARQLDREEQSRYEFTVVATDTSHVDTSASVTVYVQDVNDNAPVIISPRRQPSCVVTVTSHLPPGSLLTR